MGCWTEYCLLSGISAAGGPNMLLPEWEEERVAKHMANEVVQRKPKMKIEDVESILRQAFEEIRGDDPDSSGRPACLPSGLCEWVGFDRAIAVGYFDGDGGAPPSRPVAFPGFPDRLQPLWSGENVKTRLCAQPGLNGFGGCFGTVIMPDPDSEGGIRKESRYTECSSGDTPNFFILEGCWIYLQFWLKMDSLPPRVAFADSVPNMPFAGEFFEIVNSQKEPRRAGKGTLPAVRYGRISRTQGQHQDHFLLDIVSYSRESHPIRVNGSRSTASAINNGNRRKDLSTALLQDFDSWVFMRPDLWPINGPAKGRRFRYFQPPETSAEAQNDLLVGLPNELRLQIYQDLLPIELLRLASTSKTMRNSITNSNSLNVVFKEMIHHGSLRWIRPVSTFPGEVVNANSALRSWISQDAVSASDPLETPNFPFVSFVAACLKSDSMKNRRRLWGMVQQFRKLWVDYRLHGWTKNVFTKDSKDLAADREQYALKVAKHRKKLLDDLPKDGNADTS